jgi:hypothetical protein
MDDEPTADLIAALRNKEDVAVAEALIAALPEGLADPIRLAGVVRFVGSVLLSKLGAPDDLLAKEDIQKLAQLFHNALESYMLGATNNSEEITLH